MGPRRDEILETARSLYASRGVRTTSMRDLANASGVLPSTLYSHFSSKDDLVYEIVHEYARFVIDECRRLRDEISDPVERLEALVEVAMGLLDRHSCELAIHQRDSEYLATLPKFSCFAEMRDVVRETWTATIEEGVQNGQFRDDVRADILYRWIRDAVFYTFTWYGREIDDVPTKELAVQATSLFLHGLLNPQPRRRKR